MKSKILRLSLIVGVISMLAISCSEQKSSNKNDENKEMVKQDIPVEDFFKNPEKSNYKISPDGKHYSYMAPYENRMNIFIQEIGQTETVQLTYEIERDLAGYIWANNSRILFLKDTGGDENFKLFGVDITGENLIGLTDFEGVRTEFIDELEENPDEIIIGMNKRNGRFFDPYRLNVNTGELTILAENPGNIHAWMTDHNGELRVAIAIDGLETSLLYRDKETDNFKIVITTNYNVEIDPLFFTFDNKNVYATSNLGRDKKAIVLFDIKNGIELETIFEHPDVDVNNLYYSKKRKVLTTATFYTDKNHRHFFDDEIKAIVDSLKRDLGEYEIGISSYNKEEDVYIVRTYSDRSRGAYYVYDKNSDKLSLIHEVAPWFDESKMATQKAISYQSRDGFTINGYLTLPNGVEAKNLPVVVNPHGGPWARDHWGFNPEVQFLANRGYAVLQMNFRGSVGYGRKFKEASYKEWGKKMQDDITDGVEWLISEGIADKSKIAIYGASYGGYATLAGLTYTPDLYCCGVDYVGVSNLFTFMKAIPEYWEQYLEMMYDMVGHPVKDSVLLREASPVFHADKIVVPLFVAQGANDPRVNINESDQIVEAMDKRGIAVEYMVKDNEGHGFHNQENQFEFYRAMEAFLYKHMLSE